MGVIATCFCARFRIPWWFTVRFFFFLKNSLAGNRTRSSPFNIIDHLRCAIKSGGSKQFSPSWRVLEVSPSANGLVAYWGTRIAGFIVWMGQGFPLSCYLSPPTPFVYLAGPCWDWELLLPFPCALIKSLTHHRPRIFAFTIRKQLTRNMKNNYQVNP